MEEIWSLHTDYGNNTSSVQELDDVDGYRRFLSDPTLPSRPESADSPDFYCPDCGMPAQSREAARPSRNDLSTNLNNNLNLPNPPSDFFSSITFHSEADERNSSLSFESSSQQPDAELILLIQQLESERFDLIASEKRHSEKPSSRTDKDLSENGQQSAVSSPVNRGDCYAGSTEESSSDAFRIFDWPFSSDIVKAKQSTSSERRKIRIKQIDLELTKLRRLQAMEERSNRQSSRSSKATRSVSTATTPGGSVTSKEGAAGGAVLRFTSGFSGDSRSTMTSLQQPDLLLATMSTLFDVDKKKMTDVLERQCMSRDQCFLLYQQNVIPIVVRLIHDPMCGISNSPADVRVSAGRILFQLVSCQADDKRGRREGRVLHWLEEVRAYNAAIIHPDSGLHRNGDEEEAEDSLPCSALQNLRKNSSDEEFRHSICFLGGLNAVAEFIQCDFAKFDNTNDIGHATMRQYACIILTNLSFGDGCNKALLCSSQSFLDTLVHLLSSPNEDLRLNVASVIRNISWRADVTSKRSLRNSKVVTSLLRAAMQGKTENSLEVLLSALSNLSAHNDENRQEICAFEGALVFLLRHLQYRSPTHSPDHKVEEYSGSVLRSISSVIAVRPEYRRVLRENHCLEVLVEHLRSSCIVLVFNACGILWNLSARCVEDQQRLWELQAVPLLETLSRSTHEGIAGASAKAVKNLRKAREGLHGIGGKTANDASNKNGTRRPKSTGHRNGRHDDPVHSADDMADDCHDDEEFASYRLVRNTSVPSSPLISARSTKSNGSHRSATNMSNFDRFQRTNEGDRRDRAVQLMASISRQVSGDATSSSRSQTADHQQRLQPNRLSSPPLSPLKQQNKELPVVFEHFKHAHHQRDQHYPDGQVASWDDSYLFQYSQCPTQPTFRDFPPFEFPGNSTETVEKIMEEETSDECIDFGSRDNAEITQPATHHVELNANEDTVQQYNTEGTPYLSRSTSPSHSNTLKQHNQPDKSMGAGARVVGLRHNMVAFPSSPKQVSIGETSTVMMTPMICSRSSTPDHLSDVETSMGDEALDKQSVYSEFSRAPSGLVTPSFSEIPGSPSLMCSLSPRLAPKRRILPAPPIQRDVAVMAPPASNGGTAEEEPEDVLADVISKGNNLSLRRRSKKSGLLQVAPPLGVKKAPPGGLAASSQPVPQINTAPTNGFGGPFQSGLGGISFTIPGPGYGQFDGFPEDTVRTYATEGGLSNATSLSSLPLSAISGLPLLTNKSQTLTRPQPPPPPPPPILPKTNKALPPLPPKPSKTAVRSALSSEADSQTISTSVEQTALIDTRNTLSTERELNYQDQQAVSTTQMTFKWPVPPDEAPPLPRRMSSLPPSPSFCKTKTIDFIPSRSMPESLVCLKEGGLSQDNIVVMKKQNALDDVCGKTTLSFGLPVNPSAQSIKTNDVKIDGNGLIGRRPVRDKSPSATASQAAVMSLDKIAVVDNVCLSQGSMQASMPSRESEAPPVPAPFSSTKPTVAEEESPLAAADDMGGDLLADIIYGVLPRKCANKKKKSGTGSAKNDPKRATSERKMSIQNGLANTAVMSMSQSLSARSQVAAPLLVTGPTKSKSSHLLAAKVYKTEEASIQQVPAVAGGRSGLSLSLVQRALPACPSAGTSMWIDLNNGNMSSLPMAPPLKAPQSKPVLDWLSDSGSDSDVDGRPSRDKVEKKKRPIKAAPRLPSPDVFDTISQMDTVLESHFTSEASDADDGAPRRPRIVKPKLLVDGNAHKKENGNDLEVKSPKPIRGGSKKPQSVGLNGQTGTGNVKSLNAGRSASAGFSYSLLTTAHSDNLHLTPQHGVLLKQATFTKEGGPTALATPWVFPDTDVSKQPASVRQRYASVTRAPRESCSSVSSVDSPRVKAPGPRSRSARSISRPAVPLTTVSGNQVICVQSISTDSPKTQSKKAPVSSKIAFLWRGEKKSSIEKESKNGAKSEDAPPLESSSSKKPSQSISAGQSSMGLKSPTLSERLKPSRSLLSMAPRMTSTLPKKMRSFIPSNGSENGQETSPHVKKGSLTVTSV